MAISKVVASQAAVLLAAYLCLKKSGVAPLWAQLPVLHAAINSGIVSLVSLPSFNRPGLLGKTRDGGFPIWSTVVFGPFHVFVRLYVYLKRWKRRGRKEPAYVEVAPGLFLGGWPDSHKGMPPGQPAIVDCTCELPRRSFVFAKDQPYLCVATWDTRAPLPAEIDAAVRWARERRAEKRPVFVHCAFGPAHEDEDWWGYEGIDGLYYLEIEPSCYKAGLSTSISSYQWHLRLGHPSLAKLRSWP